MKKRLCDRVERQLVSYPRSILGTADKMHTVVRELKQFG